MSGQRGEVGLIGRAPDMPPPHPLEAAFTLDLVKVFKPVACFGRLTAARTRLGSAVQTKGFGSAFVSSTKRLMAALRSPRERKMPPDEIAF